MALAALIAGLPGLAMAAPDLAVHMEPDTYRAANTYDSMRSAGTQACAAACAEDRRCAAWTVTPATFRLGPRCELKTSAGQGVSRPGYVSGLSGMTQPAVQTAATSQPMASSRPAVSQPASSSTLAGGRTDTSWWNNAGRTATASAAPGTVYEGPNGPVATSGMLPPPPAASQQASSVQRTQIASSVARTGMQPQTVSRPAELASPSSTQQSVKRTVTRRVVAEQPPASIARPQEDAARYVTKPAERPAPQLASATPGQSPSTVVTTRTVPTTSQSAPSAAATAPARTSRDPLPNPRERGVPLYSVQRMGQFPGDYDATAGFVEGLPEDARVESVRANDPGSGRNDSSRESDDDDDESWPEEYPDPLGGPIGSEPLGGSEN